VKNIFTIDLEEWFHANYYDDILDTNKSYEIRVLDSTYKLLKHFEENNTKATFFVLGYVAKKHKKLIMDIHNSGHEIASHGTNHYLVYKQTKEEFKEDVYKSKALLEDIIQKRIKGYRAPSWSITNESLWALDILQDMGFVYDSSISPIKTFLYGIKDAPRFIYKPIINGEEGSIFEIPPSTFKIFGKTMGFSGGFYLRALPFWIIKILTNRINKYPQNQRETFDSNNPVIFYLHPREIDKSQPKLKLKPFEYIIHYLNINSCEDKLHKVLNTYKCASIEEYYCF